MKHGSLFSGIGGFDLASEWMAWENVFHCEWNEFGQKVLKYYWPDAISYGDITKTNFSIHRGTIDILTGGFPCQPYSQAGKRKGKEDDRHLWPEMLRAIREIQPRWVVGENVFGLINWNGGMVFDEVQTDLEAEGYEVWPYVLPACSQNAPHRRDRIWFIAYSKSNIIRNDFGNDFGNERYETQAIQRQRFNEYRGINEEISGVVTNPCINGFKQPKELTEECNVIGSGVSFNEFNSLHGTRDAANTNSIGQSESGWPERQVRSEAFGNGETSCGLTQMIDGQLNPRFVAEMMGYTPNWLELPFQNIETKV